MAKKLDRPFTLAERVYQYALTSGWSNDMRRRSSNDPRFDRYITKILHKNIDPKMERLRNRLSSARRFTLTPELCEAMNYPRITKPVLRPFDIGARLEMLTETARLPFPVMWFETHDAQFGYLFCRNGDDPTTWLVSVFFWSHKYETAQILACSFVVGAGYQHTTARDEIREQIVQTWGFRSEDISDADFARLESFATAQLDPYIFATLVHTNANLRPIALDAFTKSTKAMAGMLPFFIELIATLNTPHVTLDLRVTKGFYQYKLRNMPYLTTNTITINCAPHVLTKYINNKVAEHLRTRHRAHEVRGFWRHYLNGAACEPEDHDWMPDEEDPNLHHCARCAGRRRWIKEHTRGDASLGYVNHSYKVVHDDQV